MLRVDSCAEISLAFSDCTKDNLCLFDILNLAGACNGHVVEGKG